MSSGYFNDDTIIAIATAANVRSPLGVIRVSGKDSWNFCSQLLKKLNGSDFNAASVDSHRLYRCHVISKVNQRLDDALFVWMKAPNSFTGEDVIEFHLHGSPIILDSILKELISLGARSALPGEFSFRAFQNGKLTLDQAESVSDLISSRTPKAAEWALENLLGENRKELKNLKERLVRSLAEIEIDIDFSDQGLSIINYSSWASSLVEWCGDVQNLRKNYIASIPLRDGVRIALVGAPNSGKSSLFNALLKEDRSIVSDIAGTTRDVVHETLLLNGLVFRLADTAGIRETSNQIEAKGIERSFNEIKGADLVLWVVDLTEDGSPRLADLESKFNELNFSGNTKVVLVFNKSDLCNSISKAWRDFLSRYPLPFKEVSAFTGSGVPELAQLLSSLFPAAQMHGESFLIGRTRHFEVLGRAVDSVERAIGKVGQGVCLPDLLSLDLREAISCINEMTGEFTNDDLLTHIFSEFCIGK